MNEIESFPHFCWWPIRWLQPQMWFHWLLLFAIVVVSSPALRWWRNFAGQLLAAANDKHKEAALMSLFELNFSLLFSALARQRSSNFWFEKPPVRGRLTDWSMCARVNWIIFYAFAWMMTLIWRVHKLTEDHTESRGWSAGSYWTIVYQLLVSNCSAGWIMLLVEWWRLGGDYKCHNACVLCPIVSCCAVSWKH